jgi:hypothetical protein
MSPDASTETGQSGRLSHCPVTGLPDPPVVLTDLRPLAASAGVVELRVPRDRTAAPPSRAVWISDPTTAETTSRFWVFRADRCLRLHYGVSTESTCDQRPAPRERVGWWRDSHWLDLDATDPLVVRHIEHLLRLSESLMGACR